MTVAADDAPIPPAPPAKRCTRCGYVLDHIATEGPCPECGQWYDLTRPRTYTLKPPYVSGAYWLPAWLTAFATGVVLYVTLIPVVGYGWSTVFAVPAAVGVTLGYAVRAGWFVSIVLALALAAALMFTLMAGDFTGGLCALVLFAVTIGPLVVGMGVGVVLRNALKKTSFPQKAHLPILVGGVVLLAALEGRHDAMAIVTTNTVATINATPEETWRAVQFYEQVRHRPPLLLWVSPSLRPQYTTGASQRVGDQRVCVYAKGRLVKEITEVVPGRRLAFRVVEQTDIENDGVTLLDGRFDLVPTADGRSTTVTLTTRYTPKLAPRFAFRSAEDWTVHTLHGHVLEGMKRDAERATP